MEAIQLLSRSEMKDINAGNTGCSDLYCSIGGNQRWMGSDCFGDTLSSSLDRCVQTEELFGHTCGGCAEM